MVYLGILAELVLLYFLSQFISNAFFNLFYRLFKSQTVAIHILAFLFLPGVIIHELAHAIVAKLLFVHVGSMEFWPKRIENSVKLGSVEIGKADPIRRALTGLAPIVIGLIVLGLGGMWLGISDKLLHLDQPFWFSWQSVLFCLFLFEVSNTMFSSKKDLEGFFELIFVIGLLVGVFYVFLWLTGITLPSISIIVPKAVDNGELALSIVLGMAVVINGVVAGVFHLLSRR